MLGIEHKTQNHESGTLPAELSQLITMMWHVDEQPWLFVPGLISILHSHDYLLVMWLIMISSSMDNGNWIMMALMNNYDLL